MSGQLEALGRVGVVIVTYRSAHEIADCLRSLPSERLAAVVVVDNDSPDDTVGVIQRLGRRDVRVVQRPNDGFGAGCNTGLTELPPDAQFVLFLNPDARISEDSVLHLVRYLDEHPASALVGPRVTAAGQRAHSAGRLPVLATELKPLFPRALGRLLPERRLPPTWHRSGPVGYVEGACMLGRTEALRSVGGFDETYFLCFEEMDLAKRLSRADWSVDLCVEATVEHAGGASRRTLDHHGVEHLVRSQVYYLRTWRGRVAGAVFELAARGSWRLRLAAGRLTRGEYEARIAALGTPLRPADRT